MEYVGGTGDHTGQADWLDADGPESQARESLTDFKQVVLELSFRDPLWLPCQDGQKVRPRRWEQWEAVQSPGKDGSGPKPCNLKTMLGKEPFLQKTGGQSKQSPNQR